MTANAIVATTDGSEESLRAVEWAARESVLHGAPLRIVSAASVPKMVLLQIRPDRDAVAGFLREQRDRALAAAAARAVEMVPGLLIHTEPLEGQPARAVTESGSGALMLVVGSRGAGAFAAMVLGSVARHAADHASCPVVVVRDETAAVHRMVGVGIGDLDNCAASLTFAFEEAALRKASLMAIHARHIPQTGISQAGSPSPVPGWRAIEAEAARQLAGLLNNWREKYPGGRRHARGGAAVGGPRTRKPPACTTSMTTSSLRRRQARGQGLEQQAGPGGEGPRGYARDRA